MCCHNKPNLQFFNTNLCCRSHRKQNFPYLIECYLLTSPFHRLHLTYQRGISLSTFIPCFLFQVYLSILILWTWHTPSPLQPTPLHSIVNNISISTSPPCRHHPSLIQIASLVTSILPPSHLSPCITHLLWFRHLLLQATPCAL